ncbi:hypothetical protein [Streptomyces sp. UH6]|uniref:hypothetical protein n=1 Tax=Streptomyces sp. UH6 TaxID=2748379 RepID=UPI0015D50331|nr:hypothetical protein [Streptomyces sp. UH6]NYV73128.1 hypothetical protein [Streptomyces sp. UH6]
MTTPAGHRADATEPRRLNACGFSIQSIAAEYETDAALAECGQNMADPYFLAAFAAENEQRALDAAAASSSR